MRSSHKPDPYQTSAIVISAKEFEDMQKRKSGRGRDDSRPYPFTDLFDLRAVSYTHLDVYKRQEQS